MDEDNHLGTGKYNPELYWSARARNSDRNTFQAVCAFGLSDAANAAMERVQRHIFSKTLKETDLTGTKTLEFGCGVGRWCNFLRSLGAEYTGADISDDMLRIARERLPDNNFVKLDSTKLPFPDDSYDFVFSITVLHHNPYTKQEEIITDLIRILKPGGHLLLMEGICADEKIRPSFNMFPRRSDAWISTVTHENRAKLITVKYAQWWPSAEIGKAILRKFRIPVPSPVGPRNLFVGKIANILLPILNRFDIALMSFFPRKNATNATMLFRKQEY